MKSAQRPFPAPQWRDASGTAWHGFPENVTVLHYGANYKPATGDVLLVSGNELCAWEILRFDLGEVHPSRAALTLFHRQELAMEYAQREYWGRVYENYVGYDAHEDAPTRTSLDMIQSLAEMSAVG